MNPSPFLRFVLVLAGLYDGILGLLFLFAAPAVFAMANIPVPTHWGYVHFSAALLLIFAIMFFSVAQRPYGNRHLIAYGILLKIAYIGVVYYHWITGGVPEIFKAFLAADGLWLIIFTWTYYRLGLLEASKPQSAK